MGFLPNIIIIIHCMHEPWVQIDQTISRNNWWSNSWISRINMITWIYVEHQRVWHGKVLYGAICLWWITEGGSFYLLFSLCLAWFMSVLVKRVRTLVNNSYQQNQCKVQRRQLLAQPTEKEVAGTKQWHSLWVNKTQTSLFLIMLSYSELLYF